MRTVKNAGVRKNEILDVAEKLFTTRGYEQTSTSDILEEAKIARGTLYYYFRSKEEILDAVIQRMNENLIEKARAVVEDRKLPVMERLTRSVLATQEESPLRKTVLEEIHKPQNALLHAKLQESILKGLTPLLASLIREGNEQKICSCSYPEEVVEMTLTYSGMVFDHLNHLDEETRNRKILAFVDNLERMLKMEEGSLLETLLPLFSSGSES